MKKLLSLTAAFCLILSLAPIGAFAAEPTCLFDLSLEGSTEETLALSNKAADKSVFGAVTGGSRNTSAERAGHAPAYHVDAETSVAYLTFSYYNGSTRENDASYVGAAYTDAYKGGVFANKKTLTFEAWARPKSITAASQWGALFAVGSHDGANSAGESAYQFRVNTSNNNYTMHNDLKADSRVTGRTELSTNISAELDKWTHYVVTRDYDSDAQVWINKLYINGALKNTQEQSAATVTDYTTSDKASVFGHFIIGNGSGTDRHRAFIGDIAAFRIYDGLLSDDYIESTYKNELGSYVKLIDVTHNLSEIYPDADEFTIWFDSAPDPLTVNDEICITAASGEKVATKLLSYDAAQKTAVFSLLDYLSGGEVYTLCLDAVKDTNGLPLKRSGISFTARAKSDALIVVSREVIMKDASGAAVEALAQAKTAEISMNVSNNSAALKKIVMAMVMYDASGRLVKMLRTTDTSIAAGQQNLQLKLTTAGDSSLVFEAGCRIKAIAWSVEEGTGAIAFSAPVELS